MFFHRRAFHHALFFLLLVIGQALPGQTLKPGPQVLTFFSDVDDTDQPYGLYLPKNFNPAKKYPLVIMLHGAESNHRLAMRRVFGKSNLPGETTVEANRYFPEWRDVDYIVATPLARGTMGYQGIAEKDVYDVLADIKKRFLLDEDRVYLTGLSMGGGGTLWLGLTRPDLWAAIAPVCPVIPPGTADLAPNALNFPVYFFQGSEDPVVDPAGTRQWVERLKDLGTQVEYAEYPGVKHNSWENAYKDEAIFKWFAQFRRNLHPDRVRFSTRQYKYDSAYWVQIDELTPGTLASVEAEFTAPNRIEITTSALGALTLHLAGHPKFRAGRPVDVTIDGKTLGLRVTDALSLNQHQGTWVGGKFDPPADSKHRGAEGPIGEAISERHIYVYGSADNPPDEQLRDRLGQAKHAADWSSEHGRQMVFPRVLADKEVRPSDLESSNLILFGTKETNSLIDQFSDRLPIQLASSTGSYGLVYVFPMGTHYVVVSSGLPWWTTPVPVHAAEPAGPQTHRAFDFMPEPAAALTHFQDYIFFKDSLKNVIAEGRFDKNWRLPETDAGKMTSTGVVTITSMSSDPARLGK